MAYPSLTYTFTNGSGNIIDAGQVNTNFTDIINGISDGTKDLNVSDITCDSMTEPVYIGASVTSPFVGAASALTVVKASTGAASLASIKTGAQINLAVNDTGDVTGTKYATYSQLKRTIDAPRTDLATLCSIYPRFEIDTGGFAYTASGTVVTGLYHLGLVKTGAGALTIATLYEMYLGANTTAVTGRKATLLVGAQTNGSVGNCSITDNISWTSAWFLHSTSTSPSLLSGSLWLPNLKSGANQGAASASAGEIWVDTSAGNVLKLGV